MAISLVRVTVEVVMKLKYLQVRIFHSIGYTDLVVSMMVEIVGVGVIKMLDSWIA